jgi:hypothetical protein
MIARVPAQAGKSRLNSRNCLHYHSSNTNIEACSRVGSIAKLLPRRLHDEATAMITYKEYKTFTPHDPFVAGNNLSYFVGGYYPLDSIRFSRPIEVFSLRCLVVVRDVAPRAPWRHRSNR